MKIDRSRFLFLTGTLAAASAVALAASAAGCSKADPATTDDAATSPDGSASTDAGTTDASDASSASDGDAAACLANGAQPLDCDVNADGGPPCGTVKCQSAARYFKTDVAAKVLDCLDMAPTCEGPSVAVPCVMEAVAAACDDPTAAPYCASLAVGCADAGDAGAISQAECVSVVSGMSAAGRTLLTDCVTNAQDCELCLSTIKEVQ